MADLISMLAASGAAEGEATDADFQNTVLLLHGDGTNGAQNNTFLDASTNNFTITRNGNTTQGTFSPFSKPDGRWGAFFPVTSGSTQQQITGTLSSSFGTGNFTVDFWLYFISAQSIAQILDMRSGGDGLLVQIYDNNRLEVASSAGTVIAAAAGTAVTPNTWTHVAVVRSGTGSNQVALYINGSSVGTGTSSTNLTSATVSIGSRYTDSSGVWNPLNGYLSNFRISNTNRTITTPTAPYTSDANTLLLTCQSNRFKDNSSNAIALTLGGTTPRITPFSPFPITTAYDPAVNGGAGYFDGSGDYLSFPSDTDFAFGTGDFTVEGMVYLTANQDFGTLFLSSTTGAGNSLHIQINNSNKVRITNNSTEFLLATNAIPLNTWTHIAVVRSGTTLTIYQDGVANGSTTNSTDFIQNGAVVGYEMVGGNYYYVGYISNLRVVKGTAVYTTGFTPPTAPLTSVSGTSLLLNFTNAGIFDNTGFNALETVGNAQIDTSVKKYGTGSMEFDGSGDYLVMRDTPEMIFGTGDFTIEMWVNVNGSQGSFILDFRPSGTNGAYICLYVTSATFRLFVSSADRITSSSISFNQWYHLAITRSGTDTKMFLDGVQTGSTYTDSTNYLVGSMRPIIATSGSSPGGAGNAFNGYIDDLRITKGIARYTAAFTPPTAAFPDVGD